MSLMPVSLFLQREILVLIKRGLTGDN